MFANKLNLLLVALFVLGVLATPWFIGGNVPYVRTIGLVSAAVFLITIVVLPQAIGTPTKLDLWLKIILVLGIAWSACQLLPFGESSISQYVPATRRRLCILILAISVFFAASHLFRNQSVVPWVLGAIALNGVLVTFFGLAQTVSETDKLYWSIELIHGGQPFGPFVNGNNAGGYLIMCFAAANFFLALRVYRTLHQQSGSQVLQEKSTFQKLINSFGEGFANTQTEVLYIIAAVAITSAGVAASLSRGAIVALAVAMFVGWGLLFRRNVAFAAISVVIVGLGIGLVFYTQQTEAISSNLETLTDIENAAPNRVSHWKDSLSYSSAFLPTGSGLGTYNIMYMDFQDRTFKRWFKYAENQYLETLAELGIPGLILLLSALGCGLKGCVSLLNKPDSTSRAIGLSGLICLIGQIIAAVFDFGWFIPGNMFLFALMMGIVFAQLNWSWSASRLGKQVEPKFAVMTARLMALMLVVLCGWSVYEYSAVDARESCRRFYERFDPVDQEHLIPKYQQLAEYAVSIRPDDALAHYQLALNHNLQYRMAASKLMQQEIKVSQTEYLESLNAENEDPNFKPPEIPEFTLEDAWNNSTLIGLHRVVWAAKNEDEAVLQQIRNSEPVAKHLNSAWDSLNTARKCFDKYWFVDVAIAQLGVLMGDVVTEKPSIDAAIAKSLHHNRILYVGGVLYNQAGHVEDGYKAWNRCLRQTREFDVPILQYCLTEIPMRDFFEKVLPSEPFFRIWLAKKYFGKDTEILVKKLLLQHTKLKLEQHKLDEPELNFVLGEIERLSGNYAVSIVHFRRALELQKHQVKWRVQLARSLIAAELFDQAITELNVCELYHGDHQMVSQRLLRQAKRLRIQKIKSINGLELGENRRFVPSATSFVVKCTCFYPSYLT